MLGKVKLTEIPCTRIYIGKLPFLERAWVSAGEGASAS
jgi:hypothetical protein